jgi:hypothetical protein
MIVCVQLPLNSVCFYCLKTDLLDDFATLKDRQASRYTDLHPAGDCHDLTLKPIIVIGECAA